MNIINILSDNYFNFNLDVAHKEAQKSEWFK